MAAWTKGTEIEAQFIIQIANVGPSEVKIFVEDGSPVRVLRYLFSVDVDWRVETTK